MSTIKKPTKAAPPPKVTRAQVSENISSANAVKKEEKKIETHLDVPLEENLNRMTIDGEEARTVTEAISLLRYIIVSYNCIKVCYVIFFLHLAINLKMLINILKRE